MALGELYLGDTVDTLNLLTPFSRQFVTRNQQLSRSERVASGKLVCDIIATKKEFTLSYELIDGIDLNTYENLYNLESDLIFRVFTDNINYIDYNVLMDPIEYDRVLMFDGGLWGNLTIVLIEV